MKSPLAQFPFIHTSDAYAARRKQATLWGTQRTGRIGKAKYQLIHNRVALGHSALNYIDCQSAMEASSSAPHGNYWLIVPLSGHLELEIHGQRYTATAQQATLQPPWERYSFTATPARALIFELDPALMHKCLSEDLRGYRGYHIEGPYRNALGHLLLGLASAVDSLADTVKEMGYMPAFFSHAEEAVASCIGEAVRAAMDDTPATTCARMSAPAVQRFMKENLGADLSVRDIAKTAGVSVRLLQKMFGEYFSMGPKQMLSAMRLDRARELLVSAKGAGSVGEVCRIIGYHHLGRFSKEYSRRFGEAPSETLRKRSSRLST